MTTEAHSQVSGRVAAPVNATDADEAATDLRAYLDAWQRKWVAKKHYLLDDEYLTVEINDR